MSKEIQERKDAAGVGSGKSIPEKSTLLTKSDITKSFVLWHAFSEVSLNFERLQALAFCNSMTPILKKLYANDKKGLSLALQRHLAMYNTEANWGIVVNGITIALEEKTAAGDEDASDTAELITGLKAGLMGPLAGIGDTLDFGTLRPIVMGICIPFVMQGSVFAALVPLFYQVIYMAITSNILINLGYSKGRDSIMNILQSGAIHKVINGFGMFGLLMMGALSATYVKITTPLVITTGGGNSIAIQEMLDKIAPCMIPLLVVFAIYFFIKKKGPHYLQILCAVIVVSLLFSFLGVL